MMAPTKSKAAAEYKPSTTEPAKRCGNCTMFIPAMNRCTLVRGMISRFGVCKFWEKQK